MKFKYYNKAVFPSILMIFILRMAELLFSIEPGTEFYREGDIFHYISNGFYILIAVFYISAIFVLSSRTFNSNFLSKIKPYQKSAFVISGFLMIATTVIHSISYILYEISENLFQDMKLYILIFSVFSAIAVIKIASDSQTTFSKFITLFLPITYTLRLFLFYIENAGFASIRFEIFDVLKIASMALCLMCFSKSFVSESKRKNFTVTLWIASLFSSIRIADTVVAVIFGRTELMSVDILEQVTDACLILALLLINSNIYKKKKRKIKKITSVNVDNPELNGEN